MVLYSLANVNISGAVAASKVTQNGSLIEVGHVRLVLDLVELWRVHLLDIVLLVRFLL